MNWVYALLLNAAVATPPKTPATTAPVTPPAGEATKAADCDGTPKDKAVQALNTDPKAVEQKAVEEKALQNLGLKKDEGAKPVDIIAGATPGMGTCQ